jgi:Lon protease-like protein
MTTSPSLRPIPLFPLGTVLFPGGLLPLQIFEVRYLDMIGKCCKTGEPFGVVCLIRGSEVRKAGAEAEAFADIGTLALIREFDAPQAGLMQIECAGTQRFRIHSSMLQKHGLWTAEVEAIADDMPVEVPADLRHISDALRRVIDSLEERRSQQSALNLRLPMLEPYRLDDCGWVANRWCELLPAPPELKQRLMELDSPLMRLELVGDLLARTNILAGPRG